MSKTPRGQEMRPTNAQQKRTNHVVSFRPPGVPPVGPFPWGWGGAPPPPEGGAPPPAGGAAPPPEGGAHRKERGKGKKEKRKKEKNRGGGREKLRGFFIRPFVTGPERCSLQSPHEKTDVDLEK